MGDYEAEQLRLQKLLDEALSDEDNDSEFSDVYLSDEYIPSSDDDSSDAESAKKRKIRRTRPEVIMHILHFVIFLIIYFQMENIIGIRVNSDAPSTSRECSKEVFILISHSVKFLMVYFQVDCNIQNAENRSTNNEVLIFFYSFVNGR